VVEQLEVFHMRIRPPQPQPQPQQQQRKQRLQPAESARDHFPRSRIHQIRPAADGGARSQLQGATERPGGASAGQAETGEKCTCDGSGRACGGKLSTVPQLQRILDRFLLGRTLEFEEGLASHWQGAALKQLAADVRAAGTSDGALAAAAQAQAEAVLGEAAHVPTYMWLSVTYCMAEVVASASDVDDCRQSKGENRLVAAMCELHRRMLDAWQKCAICDGLLPSGGDWRRRPMVCGRELCRYQLVQLGMGVGCTDREDTWDKVDSHKIFMRWSCVMYIAFGALCL
jgi:hypothetical protein